MRKIEEIEQQIQQLSREEFAELRERVLQHDWRAWDTQIEADSRSGKLDELVAEAREEYESGRARKLRSTTLRVSFGRFTTHLAR